MVLLIRNGTLIDGSGAPAFRADVAVEGERIVAVGPALGIAAPRVIDATNGTDELIRLARSMAGCDEATYQDPHRYPTGIPHVIVNGQVVVNGGAMNPLPAGRVLARA